jgi:hypothetical protein
MDELSNSGGHLRDCRKQQRELFDTHCCLLSKTALRIPPRQFVSHERRAVAPRNIRERQHLACYRAYDGKEP